MMADFSIYRDTRWARELIDLQDAEGKWGWFHTLTQFCDSPVTTEGALGRLERLGYTRDDECIYRALDYMHACLVGEKQIPDRREKLHDWDAFTALILAARIRRFTGEDAVANAVAEKWANVINAACAEGEFNKAAYPAAYEREFGVRPRGGRLIDAVSFYQVSLLRDCLEPGAERAWLRYIMQRPDGIYYIYESAVAAPPEAFESKKASRYLSALELLADYGCASEYLGFAVDWLNANRLPDGRWDMGAGVNDRIVFPLSDNWRRRENRIADCTWRISAIIEKLTGG